MRKIILLFCTALAIMSCGASRSTLGKHKEHSPAQIYAEDINRTNMRAWGMRTGTAAMNLEAYAAAAARAVLAENTSTLISRTIKDYYHLSSKQNHLLKYCLGLQINEHQY